MNQVGSLKINYEGEYGPVHSVNLFELNDIHPETFNRSTMQLAPIRDIPFRIKNKDDNVFFNKVISYVIIDAESMGFQDNHGRRKFLNNKLRDSFIQFDPDDVHIQTIPEELLDDQNTMDLDNILSDRMDLLFDYDIFSRTHSSRTWRTGTNECVLQLYDPKSIIHLNDRNEVSNNHVFTDRVYDYLLSIQESYECIVDITYESEFLFDTNIDPKFKRGLKPIVLELLNDQLILNVYEYICPITMPFNTYRFAVRYKDEENYYYFIDTRVCPRWEEFLLLKESVNLQIVGHAGSLRNSNVIYDLLSSVEEEISEVLIPLDISNNENSNSSSPSKRFRSNSNQDNNNNNNSNNNHK
jgi:hypothetical protein